MEINKRDGCIKIIKGPMFSGKCEAKGTPILMFDGTIKKIEDIRAGDFLMGDDSQPRRVQSTSMGKGKLFDIVPDVPFANKYRVNGYHVLSLICNRSFTFKIINSEVLLTWINGLAMQHQVLPVDSLNNVLEKVDAFLADRTHTKEGTIIDISVETYMKQPSQWRRCFSGFTVGIQLSMDNKSMPSSVAERIVKLESLLHMYSSDACAPFRLASLPSEKREGTLFLARSLGLKAHLDGDTLIISEHVPIKPNLRQIYGISINEAQEGEFYGFTLDGNGRYLHSDMTVTHNTTELLRRFRIQKLALSKQSEAASALLVRYAGDIRYTSDGLSTHDKLIQSDGHDVIAASALSEVADLAKKSSHIYIDEGQFFPDLKDYCVQWAREGREVHVACLDGYANQTTWSSVTQLEPWAVDNIKLSAVCFKCGGAAPLTIRLDNSTQASCEIGGQDIYEACCIHCIPH
eukprot:TRINITY_DN12625_c0_g1_i1.p1 TRINITY_DN12625_c0_g1~~TRINITY_DN12625_c0_g1_i1.p1  ORF type:complete len:461 (+),score=82.65 TRINITY_DN12625_c0_g1_i1:70-1452(+)